MGKPTARKHKRSNVSERRIGLAQASEIVLQYFDAERFSLNRGAVLGELAVIQQRLAIMAGPKAMWRVLLERKEAPRG